MWILISIVALFTLIAFYTDIRSHKIPNWLTAGGIILGIAYHTIVEGVEGLYFSISGIVVGFTLLLVLYLFRGVGAGDVKLFAAIGALMGTEFAVYSATYAIFYAGVIGLVILFIRKQFIQRMTWVIQCLFALIILKQMPSIKPTQMKEMLKFPMMWAVLPAVVTSVF